MTTGILWYVLPHWKAFIYKESVIRMLKVAYASMHTWNVAGVCINLKEAVFRLWYKQLL